MKLRSAFFAAALLAAPIAVAQAQPVTGLYMNLGIGANYLQDEHLVGAYRHGASDASPSVPYRAGRDCWLVGYGLGNGFRRGARGRLSAITASRRGGSFGFPAAAGGGEVEVRADGQCAV